ncbi:nucleosome-remodeling factor subunit BPTF-like isoform X4 [Pomacea canaliculata]|uniref:nucleosome-remodeling factor subunit BPTF-like isoform X4 n=1 Tax=Pomacea canaliculata TaxID=400727 RepID=UPI000D729A78|nr:nucleosome-remodeling factor subunit BPTF-like isoform X4 [Pomacea canaliculata]
MSTRGRRARGRPPKAPLPINRTNFLRKPKAFTSGSGEQSFISTTGNGSPYLSQSFRGFSTRGRGRAASYKSRNFVSQLIADDDDLSSVADIENDRASDITDFDNTDNYGSDVSYEESDDSYLSDESLSTVSSSVSRRKLYPKRPKTPEIPDDKDIPQLELPSTATDLIIPQEHVLQAVGVYEVLRHFRTNLRLSPFTFEDFCAALICDEQCTLIAEIHICLIKALLREEESNNTMFGPHDTKDSVNISLFFLDGMTWPEIARAYLDSERHPEFRAALPALTSSNFPYVPLAEKLTVLQTLTDLFLTTTSVRAEITNEGNIHYDDHCRACHKLGDLLCCETCSAVYHLACVEPPMEEVPEEDWLCSVCSAHQVKGVTDCISEAEKSGLLSRQEPIGFDRHARKYWFLCRRIIVEGENEVWYYSTKSHVEELMECLEGGEWERELLASLQEMRDDIMKHVAITEELTSTNKGSKKSIIEIEIAQLVKQQAERAMRKAQEEAERRQREEEERKRQEEEEKKIQQLVLEGKIIHKDGENKDITMLEESSSILTATMNEVVNTTMNLSHNSQKNGQVTSSSTQIKETTTTIITTTTTTTTTVHMEGASAEAFNHTKPLNISGRDSLLSCIPSESIPESTGQDDKPKPKVVSLQSLIPNVKTSALQVEDKGGGGMPKITPGTKTVLVVNREGGKVTLQVAAQALEKLNDAGKGEELTMTQQMSSTTTTAASGIETRRILTRSKTGSLTPKQFTDSITTTTSSLKMSGKSSADDVLVINKDGEISRITRSKTLSSSSIAVSQYFRLGMEGGYKSYQNQYSTNPLALNKHQHNEERDKRRHLSHKFSLTQASEFKWNGSVYGNRAITMATLRLSIVQLENNIPAAFLHPNWSIHRSNWQKAVHMCQSPQDFALALAILEACMKPVIFNPVWHESLGHTRLQRITSGDREEMKKREKEARKRKEEEEEGKPLVWIKYPLGLKHQVWKQRGEEYRVTGGNGWLWVSSTHVGNFTPQDTVGLRSVAVKIRNRRLKAAKALSKSKTSEEDKDPENGDGGDIEDAKEAENTKAADSTGFSTSKAASENMCILRSLAFDGGEQRMNTDAHDEAKDEQTAEIMEVDASENDSQASLVAAAETGPSSPNTVKSSTSSDQDTKVHPSLAGNKLTMFTRNWGNFADKRDAELAKEVFSKMPDKVTDVDVINVSDAMQNRTHYPKVTKPYSKLDSLLERRLKAEEIESKQRAALEQQIQWKLKYEEKAKMGHESKDIKPSLDILINGLPQSKTPSRSSSCYSPLCHSLGPEACYSPACKSLAAADLNAGKSDLCTLTKSESTEVKVEVKVEAKTASSVAASDVTKCDSKLAAKLIKEEPLDTSQGSLKAANITLEEEEIDVEGDREGENSNSSTASDKLLNSLKAKPPTSNSGDNGEKSQKAATSKDSDAGTVKTSSTKVSLSTSLLTKDQAESSNDKSSSLLPGIKDSVSVAHSLSSRSGLTLSQAQLALTQAIMKMSVEELRAKIPPVRHTQDKFKLPRVARIGAKQRSKTMKKASLPVCQKFQTTSKRKSIFVLENYELAKLARRGGFRETSGFNYNCKMNNVNWIYPCPRPLFKTAWRYRTQTLTSLAAAALQLRILWACTRWDDLAVKPPAGGTNTISTETEITTTELLKRRDIGPHGLRSEYQVRKIVVPLGITNQPKEKYTPQRSGLRERKRVESPRQTEPSVTETWVPEEELELWEIRQFGEKLEKQQALAQEKLAAQGGSAGATTVVVTTSTSGLSQTASQIKAQMEQQLKQQRLALQQKRLQENQGIKLTTTTSTAAVTGGTTIVINNSANGAAPTHLKTISISAPSSGGASTPTLIKQVQPKTISTPSTGLPGTVQIKPQTTPSLTGQVQNLQIIQGPQGQLQVRGLLPGQQIIRLPDGRLQLITIPGQSTAAVSSPAVTVATTQQQPLVRPTITLRPQQPTLVVTSPTPATTQAALTPATQTRLIVPTQIATAGAVSLSGVVSAPTITLPARPATSILSMAASSPTKPLIISTTGRLPGSTILSAAGTPGTATQQLVSLAGQQVVSAPLLAGQTLLTSQASANPVTTSQAVTTLPVVSIQSAAAVSSTPAPAVVALQTSQGTASLLPGQSLLARPLTGTTATSLLSVSSPASAATLTLGQKVTHIIQASSAANSVSTSTTSATPTLARTLASITPHLQLKTVATPTVAAIKTPASPLRQVISPVPVKSAIPGTASSPLKTAIVPVVPKTAGQPQLTLQNSGAQPTVKLIAPVVATTSSPVTTASVPTVPVTSASPSTSTSPTGKYAITPQVVQQVVRQALMQNQTPEIQAKLLAMQRQIQQQQQQQQQKQTVTLTSPGGIQVAKAAVAAPTKIQLAPVSQGTEPKGFKSKFLTQEQKDDQMRTAVCSMVLKSLLDKIEREEKIEQKRQKKQESAEEKQKRLITVTLQRALFKHKEALKKEILKKRSVMEKTLQQKIFKSALQMEMADTIKRQKKTTSKTSPTSTASSSMLSALQQGSNPTPVMLVKRREGESPKITAYTPPPGLADSKSAKKRKGSLMRSGPMLNNKQRVISVPGRSRGEKVYCVCRTPYDETKFYIGCDLCSNWFHGSCVNITEEQARFIDSYICDDCRKQQENTSEELYCLCRTPYDENQFYIGCDRCQDWFHGRCVGISKAEADSIDTYICPNCQQKEEVDPIAQKELSSDDFVNLLKIVRSLQGHKMAWPFLTAVDPKDVPDYYKVIKEPMDLSMVENRVASKTYAKLSDFVKDVTKIFDNCRLYNPTDSPFYQCAEVLETYFVQKLKTTRGQF